MKVPVSWLKEYVNVDVDMDTVCAKMVNIGLEIEEVIYLGDKISGVKVGKILSVRRHPDADRLNCCEVDIGSEVIPVVTNSADVKEGDKVPVATDGALLYDGTRIKKGKMRGEPSYGMFCGGSELGINGDYYRGADCDGVLILNDSAEIGSDIQKEIGLDDYVIDVAVTSNRQDCNSVYGIARELAAALDEELRPLSIDYVEDADAETRGKVQVIVKDIDLCSGYRMQGISDVKIAPSPVWMTQRLAKAGLRGINNIVDITNYVLTEVGQPMHAFDYRDIKDGKIIVRRALCGEEIVPLDGKTYKLNEEDLVIADDKRAVGLAGIMGGLNSGVKQNTDTVMFESAKFARGNIRKTSRRLGLRSDSSARFEKGIDLYTVDVGLSRALKLVNELGCAKVMRGRIETGEKPHPTVISFDKSKVADLLGISVPDCEIVSVLSRLQIATEIKGGKIVSTVPPYRDDISRDCDIVEEIIRVYGYDNIRGTLMDNCKITAGGKTEEMKKLDSVKDTLSAFGYHECVFYPFAGKKLYEKAATDASETARCIPVANPISEDMSLLNREIYPYMLQCLSLNAGRKNKKVKLFECGKAYIADKLPLKTLPKEEMRFSAAAYGITFEAFRDDVLRLAELFTSNYTLKRSKKSFLHGGFAAEIVAEDISLGHFGRIHPSVADNFGLPKDTYVAELYFDLLLSLCEKTTHYTPFAKYPSVERDYAFVTDEALPAQELVDEVKRVSKLAKEVTLFDVYKGENLGKGKKSLAINVVFCRLDRTMTDKDADKESERIIEELKGKFGAVLR